MKIRLLVCTLITFACALNAQTVTWFEPGDTGRQEQQVAYNGPEMGFATYYAAYLAGQPTAYGEVYRPNQLTASHASLPMGTLLRVTRLDNNAVVTVRVNDRGGLCSGCVVVLSKSAADAIGLDQTGRSRVRIEKVGFSNWNPSASAVQSNNRVANSQGASNTAPATYSNGLATRSVENEQPMAWEENLRRSQTLVPSGAGAPSPVEDPYAYQPATYNNARQQQAQNQVSASNPYTQNNGVVSPQSYSIPITQGAQAANQSSGSVLPGSTRQSNPEPASYNNLPPVAPSNPALANRQTIRPQNSAILSPPPAPSAPTQAPAAENHLSAREINPSDLGLTVRTPGSAATTATPILYTTNPTTTGELTNRTILPPGASATTGAFAVQVGAFSTRLNADRMVTNLQGRGFSDARIVEASSGNSIISKVIIGQYDSGSTAQLAAEQLRAAHDLTAVVVVL
ncbi:MAG: septal ring lytic transglycosylase RlpA family protein [Bacteroidota bacterium]